jgi:hypothetical protein
MVQTQGGRGIGRALTGVAATPRTSVRGWLLHRLLKALDENELRIAGD